MEVTGGSCRLGLWFVHVYWQDLAVLRVRFATTGIEGPVPRLIRQYCTGKPVDCTLLSSPSGDAMGEVYSAVYRAVREIPYGETATYGEIARVAGTAPRVVGQAMARNPTPLVIPCHRVVGARDIGGFSPSVEIKEALLAMEAREVARIRRRSGGRADILPISGSGNDRQPGKKPPAETDLPAMKGGERSPGGAR